MGLLNIIRRMALREKAVDPRDQPANRAVAEHDREVSERWYNRTNIHRTERPSKLDPFADKLAAWLKTEAVSRKQRRTLKQVHADLVALGFTGSYGRGCRLRP